MAIPSSSYSASTLVLYLIVALLITPSTGNYLSQVCIKSKNPKFCLQVFGLNPHRSPLQLTQEAIYVLLPITYKTIRMIHIFVNVTNDSKLKGKYNVCLGYYQSITDALRRSVEYYLTQGLYSNVNAVGHFAQKGAIYCEKEFQGKRSTLTKDNEVLENYGSIIVSAVNLLIYSS
ncbi:unnamed protein product [Withania somnifera]